MLNIYAIDGRLVADPELKKTTTGKSVCSFTVACERDYAQVGHERVTDFLECVAWNGTAEWICKYFGKGDFISISGRIEMREYLDKNEKKRRVVELNVQNASFCGYRQPKERTERAFSSETPREEPQEFPEQTADEDLPF